MPDPLCLVCLDFFHSNETMQGFLGAHKYRQYVTGAAALII